MKAAGLRASFSSETPSEEEVEIGLPADGLKVGGARDVEAQHHHVAQAYPCPDSEASVELIELILPGVPRVEKQSAPDGMKGYLPKGKGCLSGDTAARCSPEPRAFRRTLSGRTPAETSSPPGRVFAALCRRMRTPSVARQSSCSF